MVCVNKLKKMSYRLFIDDERFPVGNGWIIARGFTEAKIIVSLDGIPDYISFDHDLGLDSQTGADFANWLIDHILINELLFPASFDYYVHSQNPIGAENIRGKMDAALKHIGRDQPQDWMIKSNPANDNGT